MVAAIGSVEFARRVQLIELCCSETVLGLSECGPLVVNNVYNMSIKMVISRTQLLKMYKKNEKQPSRFNWDASISDQTSLFSSSAQSTLLLSVHTSESIYIYTHEVVRESLSDF
jgi:hypothetical protein